MIRLLQSVIGERNPVRIAWHHGKAVCAALRYGFPARKLTVIGITGTDGKTTTVGMIAHILDKCAVSAGAASTAFLQVRNKRYENATHLTSLSPFALQRFLRRLVGEGCTHAVIEMSSHGLVQGRVSWTFPAVAAITNTALEHLDYHGNMNRYRRDKGKIFAMLQGQGTKVLNLCDESYAMYAPIPTKHTLTFGNELADAHLKRISADTVSCSADMVLREGKTIALKLSVPGTYNLNNAVCAILCAKAVSIAPEDSARALGTFTGIPGRMERIDEGQLFSVYVDFAVSPQAYEKALGGLRTMIGGENRILVLCGSCGNRMREKRPEIGRICSALADVVVATEDETYGEDPHMALEEMWAGINQQACEAHKIFDRTEAITFLLKNARAGDAVILCGMGPFSTFTKLEGRVPWDEREVARNILRTLKTDAL